VPAIEDNAGIDYDAEHGVLYHSDLDSNQITVTDLNGAWLDTFICPGAGGFNSGVTFVENKPVRELWVTDYSSDITTRCLDLTKMFVRFIYMTYFEPQPGVYVALSFVRILDETGAPVPGAAVSIEWTLPDATIVPRTRPTNPGGVARFFQFAPLAGTYQLCVTNVTKTGYLYDPIMNVETCDWVTVP
jgi:hypothetical protein